MTQRRFSVEGHAGASSEHAVVWPLQEFLQLPAIQQMVDRENASQFPQASSALTDQLMATVLSDATLNSRRVTTGSLFANEVIDADRRLRFTVDAIERGASAVFLSGFSGLETDTIACFQNVPFVLLQQVPVFLLSHFSISDIGTAFYAHCYEAQPADIYGVTGTNGKTSCAWLLADVAENLSVRSGVVGTLGYGHIRSEADSGGESSDRTLRPTGYTTPDAIEMQKVLAELAIGGCRLVAIEVSSHGLDQGRVDSVDIKTAIFTNLSHDHLDYHDGMEGYFQAKKKLFEKNSVEFAVVNLDDPYAKRMIAALSPEVAYLTYSVSNEHADIHAKVVRYTLDGIRAEVATPYGLMRFSVGLVGDFNLGNLLAVMAAFLLNGYKIDDLQAGLSRVSPPPGRMQLVNPLVDTEDSTAADVSVIVDFAHTPDALEKVLATLRKHCQQKLWCVFGCGGDRDREKRPEMAAIAEAFSDQVIVTVDNSRFESKEQIVADICAGFSDAANHGVVISRDEAVRQAIMQAESGDVILLAGKGHEEFIIEAECKIPFSDLAVAKDALRTRMGVAA